MRVKNISKSPHNLSLPAGELVSFSPGQTRVVPDDVNVDHIKWLKVDESSPPTLRGSDPHEEETTAE